MDDNIQPFPGKAALPENPLQIEPRPLHYCSHEAVTLCEHTRTVRCADPKCGAVLDPFNFLAENAKTIQRAWSAYHQAMRQANEVAERVTVLKKEEQRLRATVKRLQEKVPVLHTGRGRL